MVVIWIFYSLRFAWIISERDSVVSVGMTAPLARRRAPEECRWLALKRKKKSSLIMKRPTWTRSNKRYVFLVNWQHCLKFARSIPSLNFQKLSSDCDKAVWHWIVLGLRGQAKLELYKCWCHQASAGISKDSAGAWISSRLCFFGRRCKVYPNFRWLTRVATPWHPELTIPLFIFNQSHEIFQLIRFNIGRSCNHLLF